MTSDFLLEAIRDARQRKEQADRELRLLIAYAREVVSPRPYRLVDLAEAAGMSISGVRIAYRATDVAYILALLKAHQGTECEQSNPPA